MNQRFQTQKKARTSVRTCILCSMLLFCITCLFCGCGSPAASLKPISKTGFYFNTVITLTLYDSSQEPLLDECFSIAEQYENMFSASIDSSEISKINQAGGSPVLVSDETIALIQKGLEYCKRSEGRFDITIGKLSSLWNFSENEGFLPNADEIADAVSTIDYQKVSIHGNEVQLSNPDTHIDLGGIAKGYIADRMKEYLEENDVTAGLINLGGNVLCLGAKTDGSSYRIGIQKPFDEDGAAAAIVDVTDKTVVSSGVYERYITVDGQMYHHILNPSTGYPYETNLLGVSIICENSADGDGLSTTCFALGLEAGMELIESLADTEAVFITDDNELHCSSGIGTEIPFEKLN